MNHCYRHVWNEAAGQWVVASEIAKSHGGRGTSQAVVASVAAALGATLLSATPAWSAPPVNTLPQGGQVVAGQAAIATTTNRMVINQGSDRAIINWQSFSVGANAAVNIVQPSATSALLNRITGNNASEIYGQLTANGRVYLSNPAGILFAPGSQVDVGALTATTRSIGDADFMAGRDVFSKAAGQGDVTAQGSIRANEKVVLQGAAVNVSGVVQATGIVSQGGQIWLDGDHVTQEGTLQAAGGAVDIRSAGGIQFNGGSVSVASTTGQGGRIDVSAQGNVTAVASHTFDASGTSGGQVHIGGSATGRILSSATIHADGSSGAGGAVSLTAGTTALLHATVTADGRSGGSVHVGGAWQGGDALAQAKQTYVGGGSVLSAQGSQGPGGEVVSWSTDSTQFLGSAQAGGASGQGGRIEISSKDSLGYAGTANAGVGGQVLFDPKNINIVNTSASALSALTPGGVGTSGPTGGYNGYGNSLAIDGDHMAIGASMATGSGAANTGVVYLFNGVGSNFSGLSLQRTLNSPTGRSSGYYGVAVALNGDLLAVGAMSEGYRYNGTTSYQQGMAHLYSGVNSMATSAPTLRRSIGDTTYGAALNPASMPILADQGMVGFGSSIALSGDNLAVGAAYLGGGGGAGQVYLFNGVGTDFSGLTFRRLVGQSTSHQAASNPSGMPSPTVGYNFGIGVALDGDLMVIGEAGYGNYAGAVYLYNGVSSSNFSGLTYKGLLGRSSDGATRSPSGLSYADGDYFGAAVALNNGHLAVGASYANNYYGGVYLFTGVGTDFSGLTLDRPSVSGSDYGGFGTAVALSGNLLAVGSPYGPTGGEFTGRMNYYNWTPATGTSDTVASATFSNNPSANSNITPGSITAILNTGSSVTLQANNDITVTDNVIASGGSHGNLTLRAGRNITFNANVTTNNGDLTAVAGDTGANATYTDAGTPTLTIASGKSLNVGTGTATLAAVGGNVVNNAGNSAIVTSGAGHWLIYAANPTGTTEGFSSYNKHYNQSFTLGSTPAYASSGNWFLYAIAPTLTVTPGSQTITYGSAPSVTGSYTGFIDGDTASTSGAVTGSATWSVGGSTSTSGNYTVGQHDVSYVSGLASSLGYTFQNNAASSNELTVNALQLTVGGSTSAATRAYNGTTSASISGGSVSGVLANDLVSFSQSGSFTNANAGPSKSATYTNSITGTDASNYTLSSSGGSTTGIINRADITVGTSNATKTYDGTTAAAGSAVLTTGTLYTNASNGNVQDSLSGGSFAFSDRNAGTGNKTVSTSGVTVSDGNSGGNYNVTYANNTTSTINKATLTVGTGNVTKTYDGTTSAAGTAVAISGLGTGDTLSGGTFAFSNANAGTGNKTVNTSGVTVNDGNGGANYNALVYQANTTSTINKATLTVSTSDVTKTYDGTLAATGSAVVTAGTLYTNASNGNAQDSLSGGSFAFTNANAGTGNKAVNTSGVTVSDGNGGGNYTVTYANNTTSTINKANITVGTSNVTKTYDGTTTAASTAVLTTGTLYTNASNGNVQDSLSGGTFAFSDRNAGTGNKTVSTSGVTVSDGNSGGNYNVTYASNTTSTINKATLTVGTGNVTKTYDGTTSATGTAVAISGLGTGDTLSGGTFAFSNANAGTGNKTVNTSGVTVNDGNGGANYNALVYQANTTSTINKATLTVSTSDVTKTYDGTLAATGSAVVTAGTLYTNASNGNAQDSLSGGTFAFTNANAGTGNKAVSTSGVTVSDGNGGGNYNVTYANNTTSTINKANITVGTSNVTKTYDGTTAAAGTAVLTTGTLYTNASNGNVQDSLSGGSFAFSDRNAGTGNKTVSTSGVTVSDGNSGGNYNVTYASNTTSTINKATLTITPTTQTRSYDGTTVSSAVASVTGVQTGDSVTGVVQAFDSRNAGARTLGITSYTLNDGNNGNNYIVNSGGTVAGTISKANLTVSTSDVTKTYDAGTSASGVAVALSGLASGDTLSGGSFAFADKNAGTGNKTVTVAGVAVNDGNGGQNYNPISYIDNTTSTINRAVLTVGAVGVNKVYDTSTTATVTLNDNRLGSDLLTLGYGAASFANKQVGDGKAVSVSGITVTGTDAGNYTTNTSTTASANITPATITGVTGITALNKVFDGNPGATLVLSGASFSGLLMGDALSVGQASGHFADSIVGVGKPVTVTGITLAGADAGNYVLANTGATTQADIKALPVDLTYVAYHAPIANPSGVGNTTYGNNLGSSGQGELASAPAPGVAATAPAQPRGNQGSAPRAPSVRPLNSWVDVVDNGVLIAP